MDAIRVQNLRSLEDTGWVDLKPLTLLVGKNSSGKSTFLRCFPLFRQSVESRIVGPILWYEPNSVDFGSFKTAVSDGKSEITFHFQFSSPLFLSHKGYGLPQKYSFEIMFTIVNQEKDNTNYIQNCIIKFAKEHVIEIKFDNNKIIEFNINGSDCKKYVHAESYHKRFGDIIPILSSNIIPITETLDISYPLSFIIIGHFQEYLQIKLNSKKIDAIESKMILASYQNLTLGSFQEMLNNLKNVPQPSPFWEEFTQNWTTDNNDFKELCNLILIGNISNILLTCNEQLNLFSSSVVYIGPARATVARYYRVQNLAVDRVESDGSNLPIILMNLKPAQKKEFNNWLLEQFGFEVNITTGTANISIELKDNGEKKSYNLADKGFGFSQILPVITQLWMLINSKTDKANNSIFFAIEQPELHLHPELQAQLAQAFVVAIKEAKAQNRDLRLIIETHSETIVNKLGQLIDDQEADNNDINVVVFDKSYPDEPTKVTFSHYNEEGYLVNWPIGFFEPEGLA